MRERRPDRILSMLNQSLLQQRDDETFCTAVFARLQPARSGARLTLAGAGHPYPLLLRRDGHVEAVGEPSLFLGVLPEVQFTSRVVDLKPEDALVFYTDGVTETRRAGELFGEERLAKLVGSCAGLDAKSIVRSIEQQVMEFQGGSPQDDVAILALRIHP
jgi:sigma-B regulation protein RsbU (phosphoserine phosphatase)